MMFSISYGFWTDQVKIAGDSKIGFRIKINKDIELAEELTDAAIELNNDFETEDINKDKVTDKPEQELVIERESDTEPIIEENETVTEEELVPDTVPEEEEITTDETTTTEEPITEISVPLEEEVQGEETSGDIS